MGSVRSCTYQESRILAVKVLEAACKVKQQQNKLKKALTGGSANPAYMLNIIEMKCNKDHQEW